MEFSLRGYLSAGVAFARDAVLRCGGSQSPLATLARLQFVHRAPFVAHLSPARSYQSAVQQKVSGQYCGVSFGLFGASLLITPQSFRWLQTESYVLRQYRDGKQIKAGSRQNV